LRDSIRHARAEIGPDLAGYILDLRGNPGGLLDQSVAVSDMFVTNGRIVSTHGRHPDSHQYFDAEPDDLTGNMPVVVLVNGNSASASEIVAAALQDSGRAVVVGTSSYGKGTVQTVLRLPNEGELTLTWARFHAPSGYALNGRGVMPDICTANQSDGQGIDAEQILDRVRTGQLPLPRSVIKRDLPLLDESGIAAFRAACPPSQGEAGVELEVALRLLEDPALFARAIRGVEPATNQALAGPHTPGVQSQ
jgi:carboxyl-terminal processing protease